MGEACTAGVCVSSVGSLTSVYLLPLHAYSLSTTSVLMVSQPIGQSPLLGKDL